LQLVVERAETGTRGRLSPRLRRGVALDSRRERCFVAGDGALGGAERLDAKPTRHSGWSRRTNYRQCIDVPGRLWRVSPANSHDDLRLHFGLGKSTVTESPLVGRRVCNSVRTELQQRLLVALGVAQPSPFCSSAAAASSNRNVGRRGTGARSPTDLDC
jgi:hypothetical protein